MDEPLTISKEAPLQKSMNYELLREEGLKYIQNIAGKVWTDFNTHDPGVTILEILCYALTDLGYRTSYDIKDIIALNPEDTDGQEIYNFFTAAQILPNAPVTASDYRKLMIDVEIHDPADPGCKYAGVKNAWIEKVTDPEADIYVNKKESKLVYEPVKQGDDPLNLKILHNILLEFDRCETYGDLNDNKIISDLTITEHAADPELEGLVIRVDVEFPRWDDKTVDWEDKSSLSLGIRGIELSFMNLGGNFTIDYELNPVNEVILTGTKTSPSGPVNINGLNEITLKLNQFIFDNDEGMIRFYRDKINKIREITGQVKATLQANRNLCEDYIQLNALRIEEILVCADIELELDADVEETQARMYHEIARFLSPTVYFYSLEEMMTRCFDRHQYDVTSIDTDRRVFTIDAIPETFPEEDTVITITGSTNNNGPYRVKEVRINSQNELRTDIHVQETIPSDILTEGQKLYLVNLDEEQCTPVEKIFEGPLLKHGFIDDEELAQADRKEKIHVSDLIQIIMDVPGVTAVREIQIANVPQDNEDGAIESKSVRWCLELAFEQNYVPRLNTDNSRITFYKDQLPFRANRLEVDSIIEKLEREDRPQKQRNPVLDIDPPVGEFKNLEDYYSIQNEFPLVYGIGEEGVPSRTGNGIASDLPTETHARQLKGFLMHFDQLLANYLSQLAHVKELFSMNPQKDQFGNFVIGRTYYTQPLFDIVPNVEELYLDMAGHAADLNDIAENEELFWERRNRFLDHLMARFAEQFTDYALLTSRISGAKAQNELIEDKLAFLNSYPELSSRRGTAMNYEDPCRLWHKDNVSGLEHRAALLTGIDERKVSTLNFSPHFKITGAEPNVEFAVENDTPEDLLKSIGSFESIDEAKERLEEVVLNGVSKHKFDILTDDSTNYYFQLICDGRILAESVRTDFTTDEPGGDADQVIDEVIGLLRDEFNRNPESNRHNLACPLLNYFDYNISIDMVPDPPVFTIEYQLYETPFIFDGSDPILTGSFTGSGDPKRSAPVTSIDTATSTISVEGNITENLAEGDVVVIKGSDSSDGTYTISNFTLNGNETDIEVEESIPSDAAPLGSLHYNQMTEEELHELAESSVHDVLWRVVANGVRRGSYKFDPAVPPFTSPYKFQIRDYRGNQLGESRAFDFNNGQADEIANVSDGIVTVKEPGDDPDKYEYSLVSASANGPYIDVEIDTLPSPGPSLEWQLMISDMFPLKEIDRDDRTFIVEGDVSDRLSAGDSIFITGSESNDGDYSVISIVFDGSDSMIKVQEPIPSEIAEGELNYTKSFPVVKSSGNIITIRGGGDEAAVQEMIRFLESKFFDHEGMHLIEHILLRPKTDEPLFVDADEDTLTEGLADNGSLLFTKQYSIVSADSTGRTFVIEGDVTTDLTTGMKITIQGSPLSNGEFTVESFSYTDPNTEIVVEEVIIADIAISSTEGILSYSFEEEISAIDAAGRQIIIPGNLADVIASEIVIEVTGSADGQNDGKYTVENALNDGSDTAIVIEKAEQLVRDCLLSINLDEDCECILDNPYTCMAHVVLPYWPGRFTNNDFRKFFEKTLRREAPAHVFLNICWVSCSHMAEFEQAYKAWLIENSRSRIDKVTLSKTLQDLIDSIEKLRNVYPEATLHDCDEDENLENSIILNHSVLGEI